MSRKTTIVSRSVLTGPSASNMKMRFFSILSLLILAAALGISASAQVSTNFETGFATGTPHNQNGWVSLGSAGLGCGFLYDHAVTDNSLFPTAPASFGTKSLRISNYITSGCFDATYSASTPNEAGETGAANGGLSGGTRQSSFVSEFTLASVVPTAQQPDMYMSVAPDRGDGGRMSYLRFEDDFADGIHVIFDEYKDAAPYGTFVGDTANGCGAGDDFTDDLIAVLNRSVPHTIKFVMVFLDGPRNDFVQIYVDGVLTKTGTSWEDYFRYCEGNPTRTVDSLGFRTGGAGGVTHAANQNKGFFIDNQTTSTGAAATSTVVVNQANINNWLFYNDENDVVDPTLGSFVSGPGTTPLGTGSAQISVSGTQRRNLATYQFSGTPLAAITTMKYSTYNPSAGNGGSPNRAGYLNFNVDFNGSDTFQRRLSYIPAINGTVIQNDWQEWDTINGGNALWLYSGPTWPGTAIPGNTARTWNDILTSYPGVRMKVTDSFLGIRVGEPYADGYTENIDAFKFGTSAGTTQFDFDPATTISVSPATSPNALDNDYTRINNAVQAIPAGGTVVLNGTFNWAETNANASWVKGSNNTAQGGAGDDYTILPPANRNNVTITAPSLGAATIQGPGDVPTLDLEGVFQYFNDGDNQNTTISNLQIYDFDLAIGMFNGAGGSDAYNGTKILNNHIRTALDVATATDTLQNIGIHYSFGTNQQISGNTIDLNGGGTTVGSNFSSEVGVQSNTSGGAIYNGLQITNNTINVLNAQSANPQSAFGIWENGHAHSSTMTISGNQFVNLGGGNNPALNLQRGFRVTSHSSGSSTVTYSNNRVSGANIGFQWIAGSAFAGNQAVRLTSNTLTGNNTGVLVQSQGVANLSFNRIVGNGTGVANTDGIVTAENNWWGCNYGPGAGGAGCTGTANGTTGTVDANPWLKLTTDALPTVLGLGGTSAVTSSLTINSDNVTPGGGSVPNGIAVGFAGVLGTVSPSSTTTTAGAANTTFTATAFGSGGVNTTVDAQVVNLAITITASCSNVSAPTNVTSLTGGSPSVPVNVDNVTGRGIFSTDMTVNYNPAVISSPVVTLGTVPNAGGPSLNVNTSTPGVILISIFASQPFSGAGTLVNIGFTANGAPGTSSAVSFGAFKFNEGSPCSTVSNGLVTILSGTITGTVTYGNPTSGAPAVRPVPNAALNAAGSVPVSALTNASGVYSLSGMGSGPYTVTPSKTGGTNGALSALDSARIAQFVVNLFSLSATQQTVADVSGTGGVTSFDAALIARYVVNLPNTGSSGTWRFTPVNRSYPNVNTDQTGQDYTALLMGDVTGNWGDPVLFRLLPGNDTKAIGVTAGRVTASPNSEVVVPVTIGDVSGKGVVAYQFEMSYDPDVLAPAANPVEMNGTMSDGLAVTANAETPGVLKVVIFGANALNGSGNLLNLRFTAIGAAGTSSPLSWQEFMLNEAGTVQTRTTDGLVEVTAATAQEASIGGKLLTPMGQGVPNTRVTLTDTTGASRTILSNGFGIYQFGNVRMGETYTVSVESRQYTFTPVTVSVSGDLVNVDIIAEQ
jgi:hypothetical protein